MRSNYVQFVTRDTQLSVKQIGKKSTLLFFCISEYNPLIKDGDVFTHSV